MEKSISRYYLIPLPLIKVGYVYSENTVKNIQTSVIQVYKTPFSDITSYIFTVCVIKAQRKCNNCEIIWIEQYNTTHNVVDTQKALYEICIHVSPYSVLSLDNISIHPEKCTQTSGTNLTSLYDLNCWDGGYSLAQEAA